MPILSRTLLGSIITFLCTIGIGCSYDPDAERVFDPNETLMLNLFLEKERITENTSIVANNFTVITLVAQIGTDGGELVRTVHFSASAGRFLGGDSSSIDLLTDHTGKVQAQLQVTNRPGPLYLEAKIDTFVRRDTLMLLPARPEEIVVDAGTFALQADSTYMTTTTVRALLKHGTSGVASVGTAVSFTVVDPIGNDIEGLTNDFNGFRNVTTANQEGIVTATFAVGGTKYEGLAQIVATYTSVDNTYKKEGRDTIRIIPSPGS